MKLMELVNNLKGFESRNRTELLTVTAIFTMWGGFYLAYKAGPKAEKIIEKRKKEFKEVDSADKKGKLVVAKDFVKDIAPVVGPPIALGLLSTGCSVKAYSESSKKIAILSAAYTMTNTALHEYKNKAREVLGDSKAQQVREAISKDHLERAKAPEEGSLDITPTGLGNSLCYDEYTDRYFYASAESIGQAIVRLGYRIQSEMWIALNEFYQELNLRPCKMGNDLGWSIDDTDCGRIPIYYTAILTDNNTPCLCVQFDVSLKESFKTY